MTTEDLNIDTWSKKLGLFPMPLFQDKFLHEKFILLNGNRNGNLCIDYAPESSNELRSYAWSSDVGQYLIIDKNDLCIFRWDNYREERYSIKSIENRLDSFYGYLKKQNINNQESVIRFVIQFYRQIRTLLRDNKGNNSLNVLLLLFACMADNNIDRTKLNIDKWSIKPETKDIALEINDSRWEELLSNINKGLLNRDLKPNINLLLRHAAGSLFQEAYFETLFSLNYQPTFDIFLPQIDSTLGRKNASQTSAHFTPTSMVRTIVEESLKQINYNKKDVISVLDPACGSGEFLKEFVRQIRLKHFKGRIEIFGWDISASAIDMAKFIVKYESALYDGEVNISIEEKNTLNSWDQSVDVILMNPPFISWELMGESERESVNAVLGDLSTKKPNTAGAYLFNAVNNLKDNGVIGCVIPTSIFDGDSYIDLRTNLQQKLDIQILGRLGSHSLFSEALVDAGILVAKKSNQTAEPLMLWSDFKPESSSNALRELRKFDLSNQLNYADDNGYSIYYNPNFSVAKSWLPIPYKSFELLAKFQSFCKVEDLFDVKQGVRTGLNSAFIVSKEYFEKLNNKEKKYFRPAVTNDSIINSQLNDSYYIFYAEGEANIETEEELINRVPTFYREILQPNLNTLSTRARKGAHNYWKLSEHRAWAKAYTPKIVSKEFGKAGSFAFDKTGIYIPERSHAWLPKGNNVLDDIAYAYIAILNMPIINDFLSGLSKQIGGGQWYLASKYLNKMPLPNLFTPKSKDHPIVIELIDLGIQISSGINNQERLLEISSIIFSY